MTNIAIICEYNPMHNGHIHQIKEIKKIYPNSNIIALMSGSFVQRGEPSILDKFDKAEIALSNGVDLVLEMPAIISLQSADYFSSYNVQILDKLNIIDYISFGIEESNYRFESLLDFIIENDKEINNIQKKYIQLGNSYKKSYQMAINQINNNFSDIAMNPNITLAIGYVLELKKLKSKIKYLPIIRNDGGYNSEELDEFDFQSATTIRKMAKNNLSIDSFVPKETLKKIEKIDFVSINSFTDLFIYKSIIQKKSPEDIAGYETGLLNLLIKNFDNNLEKTVEKSHNKRYSKAKLNRFIINYLLDIKNYDVDTLDQISYIRPLIFNENGRKVINQIKSNEKIKIVNKISVNKNLTNIDKRLLELDNLAYILRNIHLSENYSKNFTYKPFKKSKSYF